MARIVNKINNAKISKQKQIKLPCNKTSKILVIFIFNEGYLSSYEKKNKDLIINFTLTNQGYAFNRIIAIPKTQNISQIKKQAPYFYTDYGITGAGFSTNKGILVLHTIKKLKLGGKAILVIK